MRGSILRLISGAFTYRLQPPTLTANRAITLPLAAPAVSQGLIATSTAGATTWANLNDYILIVDQKAQGTYGGTSAAGVQTRDLNTELVDTGNRATVASNQITLVPGTYRYRVQCPAAVGGQHACWLFNVSTGAIVPGASPVSYHSAGGSAAESIGQFTIAATTVFEARHWIAAAYATSGLGVAGDIPGKPEQYTTVELWAIP